MGKLTDALRKAAEVDQQSGKIGDIKKELAKPVPGQLRKENRRK